MKHPQNVYLCRHGETIWSLSGQHTSLTDLSLTDKGVFEAKCLARRLKPVHFSHVLCSPLLRAKQTAEQSHLLEGAILDEDLIEWNYGDYEGLTSAQIKTETPDWNIFTHGGKNGETIDQMRIRTRRFLDRLSKLEGNICIFSSGHISRCIIAAWIGLDITYGRHFELSTASVSLLTYDREVPVIKLMNDISHYQSIYG